MLRVTCNFAKNFPGPGGSESAGLVFFSRIWLAIHAANLWPAALVPLLLYSNACPASAQAWQRLGPPGGNVISLERATDGSVFLGTSDGHVFASSDRGEHWQLRGRAGDRLDGVVERIVADDANRDRLLAAVRFEEPSRGGGVFESVDGARNWSPAGLAGEAVRALEHSESDPRVWIAGTRTGVFRSTDNARSWQRLTMADDPELQNVDSLAIDPANPEIIYVGTYHLAWKTTDGGKTWTSIAAGMINDSDIMSLRIDAKNPRRIFSSACSGIYRSEDAGATWVKLQGIPYASRRTQQIVQDPADSGTLYAATTEGLWKSSDYGENWKRVTPRETVANNVVVLPAAKGSRVLAGMEAEGILRSDDQANSFTASNQGFSHHVIASIAADRNDAMHLLVRLEGARLLRETRDGGFSWKEFPAPVQPVRNLYESSSGWWLSFAEGGLVKFDPQKGNWHPEKFLEATPRARVTRKSAGSRAAGGASGRIRSVLPQVTSVVESSGKILGATNDGIWKRGSTAFHRIPAKNLPRSVTYFCAGLQDSLLAIAGNSVWMGDADALLWNLVPAPQNGGRLLWIRQNAENGSQTLVLGTQNGVFFASNNEVWRLASNGLPAIASNPPAVSGSAWLLAMSNGGVYKSVDAGKSWDRIDSDGEKGRITAVIEARDNQYYIASQSEGFLRFSAAVTVGH